MIREVTAICRNSDGHTENLELVCGHNKDLRGPEVDRLAERAARDRAALTVDCVECDPMKPDKFPKMKPIPLAAAKRIAEDYGYDQVVIYARRCLDSPEPQGEHLTTYGRTKAHCEVAARMGDTLKRLMGWATEKDQYVEREAMQSYKDSIPADTHNLHCRAWSELTEAEKEHWREVPRRDWDED